MHYMNYNIRNKFIIKSLIITLLSTLTCFILVLLIPRTNYKSVSNGVEIKNIHGISNNVVIKNEYNGKRVVGIGTRGLTNQTIREVSFEENSNIEYIERRAFYSSKITSISIPKSVKYIYQNAFSYSLVEEVSFKEDSSLEAISGSMFFECSNLKRINIPKSVKSIGTFAFFKCTNLKEITIPDGVKVYADAFAYCNIVIYCNDISNFEEGYNNNANITILNY